jgi:hypothetical protein
MILWQMLGLGQAQDPAALFLPIGQLEVQERLFLRADPTLSAPISGRARWGDSLLIYEQQGQWARAEAGWLWLGDQVLVPAVVHYSAQPLRPITANAYLEPAQALQIPLEAELGVLALLGDEALVYDGATILAWVAKDDLYITEPTLALLELTEQRGYFQRLESPLYSLPSPQSAVLAQVRLGQALQVVYQDSQWALVRLAAQFGWLRLADLDLLPRPVGLATVNTGPINLRAAPVDGRVINALAFEESVLLLGRNTAGDWLQVRLIRGQERLDGWVAAQFITWDQGMDALPKLPN